LQELERRFDVFYDNMRFVAAHNQKQRSFHVALNHLADLTQAEVHQQRTGLRPTGKDTHRQTVLRFGGGVWDRKQAFAHLEALLNALSTRPRPVINRGGGGGVYRIGK
jgi:hypothetical protein